jgi:hypothetical protein
MDPGPDRAQRALDHEFPAGGVAHRSGNRAFEELQAECKKQREEYEEDRDGQAEPLQRTHIARPSKVHACRA